jgi:DNA-binding CsgD family transcriptional regulator
MGIDLLSQDQKSAIIQALYQSASDPRHHEKFVDQFSKALAEIEGGENYSWLETHIETATAVFEKLSFSGLLESSALQFVERFSGPAMIVNSSAEVLASNAAWSEILETQNLITVIKDERDQSLVRSALQSLNTILEDRTEIIRLTGNAARFQVLSFRRLPSDGNHGANSDRILVRTLGLTWPLVLIEFLKSNFELSDVEVQTARQIVSGLSLSDIAKTNDRTREAIKSHTKSIYAKLDISGREDLVRLVMQLQALLEPNLAKSSPGNNPNRDKFVQLTDGRRVRHQRTWDR